MNARSKRFVASVLTVVALGTASAQFNGTYDPALNAGEVIVAPGKSSEVTLKPLAKGLLGGGSDIKLVAVTGVPGVTAALKSVKSASGDRAEVKLEFKHEFLKGSSSGAYPVEVTLENAKTGYRLSFFVTLNLK